MVVGGLTLPQPWHQPQSSLYIICKCNSFIFSSRLIYGNINLAGFTDHHRLSIDLVRTPGDRLESHCLLNDNLLQDRTICQSFELFWQQCKMEKSVCLFFEAAVIGWQGTDLCLLPAVHLLFHR